MAWKDEYCDLIPEITKYICPIENHFSTRFVNHDFLQLCAKQHSILVSWENVHRLLLRSGAKEQLMNTDCCFWSKDWGVHIKIQCVDNTVYLEIFDYKKYRYSTTLKQKDLTTTTSVKNSRCVGKNFRIFHLVNGTKLICNVVIDFGSFDKMKIKMLIPEENTSTDHLINMSSCTCCKNIKYGPKSDESMQRLLKTTSEIKNMGSFHHCVDNFLAVGKTSCGYPQRLTLYTSDGRQISLLKDPKKSFQTFHPFIQLGDWLLNLLTFKFYLCKMFMWAHRFYCGRTQRIISLTFEYKGMILQIWSPNDTNDEYVCKKCKMFTNIDPKYSFTFCQDSNYLFIVSSNNDRNKFIDLNKI